MKKRARAPKRPDEMDLRIAVLELVTAHEEHSAFAASNYCVGHESGRATATLLADRVGRVAVWLDALTTYDGKLRTLQQLRADYDASGRSSQRAKEHRAEEAARLAGEVG